MGTFNGDIDKLGEYIFAGIKPIFKPWPDAGAEWDKVIKLYETFIAKNIPMTTHSSDGGFVTTDSAKQFTSPSTWATVLDQQKFSVVQNPRPRTWISASTLKLKFAHFGQGDDDWREKIVALMKYPNVYADLSYCGVKRDFYDKLKVLIDDLVDDKKPVVAKRLLFGSDFMVNLMDSPHNNPQRRYD
jgi:hypothetical protein